MKALTRSMPKELHLRWGDRFAAGKDVPWHTHTETELVAVTKGRCRIRIGSQILEGARGAIFVLPATVAQYQETLGVTRTTYIGFDTPPGLFDESARVLKFDSADPALQWMEQLCDSRLARPPLSNEVSRTILAALLRRIGDCDAATGSEARLHPAVRTARAHLEANLAQALTLADVARASGVSASHLSALFAEQCEVGLAFTHAIAQDPNASPQARSNAQSTLSTYDNLSGQANSIPQCVALLGSFHTQEAQHPA